MALDPKTRRELAKNARLWGLALVCALAGSITVSATGSIAPGVLAFVVALAVLGPLLLVYERRNR